MCPGNDTTTPAIMTIWIFLEIVGFFVVLNVISWLLTNKERKRGKTMTVTDDKCKQRRMKASCVPDCYDEINDRWIKSCNDCELSGLKK